MRTAHWTITTDWRGTPVHAREHATVRATLERHSLIIEVDAPLHADPPPPGPPGRQPGLWDHEVVELFLLGDDERYTEVELGPHGHYLVLKLQGVRNVVADDVALELTTCVDAGRWHARAVLAREHVPAPIVAANAYAIHGVGNARRHLAAHPVPGEAPDFHRLERFRPIPW